MQTLHGNESPRPSEKTPHIYRPAVRTAGTRSYIAEEEERVTREKKRRAIEHPRNADESRTPGKSQRAEVVEEIES